MCLGEQGGPPSTEIMQHPQKGDPDNRDLDMPAPNPDLLAEQAQQAQWQQLQAGLPPLNPAMNQPMDQAMNQSMNQAMNQSLNQSMNQPMNQAMDSSLEAGMSSQSLGPPNQVRMGRLALPYGPVSAHCVGPFSFLAASLIKRLVA